MSNEAWDGGWRSETENGWAKYHISGHIPGMFRLRGRAAQIPFKFEISCDNIGVYHSRGSNSEEDGNWIEIGLKGELTTAHPHDLRSSKFPSIRLPEAIRYEGAFNGKLDRQL
jgi:hypothetical protein